MTEDGLAWFRRGRKAGVGPRDLLDSAFSIRADRAVFARTSSYPGIVRGGGISVRRLRKIRARHDRTVEGVRAGASFTDGLVGRILF
jgi:hypothetical protein